MFTYGKRKNSDRTGPIEVTDFCLVRHGSTDWNIEGRIQGWTDTPLNDQGKEEARITGKRLRAQGWDVIISSNLKRARETAEIIGAELEVAVLLFPELRERNFGPLEGKTQEELAIEYPEWNSDSLLPGVEGKNDLRDRAEKAFTVLARLFSGRRIIIVSHGGFIRAFFHRALRTERSLNNAEAIEVFYADGSWRFSDEIRNLE